MSSSWGGGRPRATSEEGEVDEEGEIRSPGLVPTAAPPDSSFPDGGAHLHPLPPPLSAPPLPPPLPPALLPPLPPSSTTLPNPPPPPLPPGIAMEQEQQQQQPTHLHQYHHQQRQQQQQQQQHQQQQQQQHLHRRSGQWGEPSSLIPGLHGLSSGGAPPPAPPFHGDSSVPPQQSQQPQPQLPPHESQPPPNLQQQAPPPSQPPLARAATTGGMTAHLHNAQPPQQQHHHHPHHHQHQPHHHSLHLPHQHPSNRFEHRHSMGGPPPGEPPHLHHSSSSAFPPPPSHRGGGVGPGTGVQRSQSFSGLASHPRGPASLGGGGAMGGGGPGSGPGGPALPQSQQPPQMQQPTQAPLGPQHHHHHHHHHHRPTDPRFRGAPPQSSQGDGNRSLGAPVGGGPGIGGGQPPPYPDQPPGSSSSSSHVFSSYSMLADKTNPSAPGSTTTAPPNAPPAYHPQHHQHHQQHQPPPSPVRSDANNLLGGPYATLPPLPPFPPSSSSSSSEPSGHGPTPGGGPYAPQQQGPPPQQQPQQAPHLHNDRGYEHVAPPQQAPPHPHHHDRGYDQPTPPPPHNINNKPFGPPGFRRGMGRGPSGGPGPGGERGPSGGGASGPPLSEPLSYYGPSQQPGQPPQLQQQQQPPIPRHSPTRFFPPGGRDHRGMGGPGIGGGGFQPADAFRRGGPGGGDALPGPDLVQLPPPPLTEPSRPAGPPPFGFHHRDREPDRPGHPLDASTSMAPPPPSSSSPLPPGRDSFGRTREWGAAAATARSGPHASPRGHRKDVIVLNPPESAAYAAAPASGGGLPPPLPKSRLPASVSASPASPPPQPPPLTTLALGEDAARGEGAVRILAQILPASSLPPHLRALSSSSESAASSTEPEALELPNKQLLFRALATVDGQLKVGQRQLDAGSSGRDEARARHQQTQSDLADAVRIDELERDERRQQLEHGRLRQREEAQRFALLAKEQERICEWERAEELEMQGIESELLEHRRREELQHRDEASKQVAVVNEHFHRELADARHDLEQLLAQTLDMEIQQTAVEAQYQAKVRGTAHGVAGIPKTPDVVAIILARNQKRAAEAHMLAFAPALSHENEAILAPAQATVTGSSVVEALQQVKDPKEGKSNAEWAQLAQQVTGLADALYTEPSEAPYFEANEKNHTVIAPLVKEFIRDKRSRLQQNWTDLAEEYEFRRKSYNRLMKKRNKGRKQNRSSSVAVRHSILGIKPGVPILESSGSRASTNPYRRARRGNEVRSEYEQEQIIAEIAAKEAMEKKIHFGGSKLPRQVGRLERQLTATFVQTFTSQRVDVFDQEQELAITNVWSDTEKCIFLDRFMQHPKDFRKISSFLRNKSTRDCVAHYYDSKQTVPYKAALKEHIMRRKRRGDYHTWDATIDAALSCGATVEAGTSEDKPLLFLLPEHDQTFSTFALHPIKREMFESMEIDEDVARAYEDEEDDEEPKKSGQKRKYEPLFKLAPEKRRFLQSDSPETVTPLKASPSRTSLTETEVTETSATDAKGDGNDPNAPLRRAPQKWTNAEKKVFVDTLEKHGRNWSLLAEAVGTKSISQIKNFYYDFKKQSGKVRQEKDVIIKKPPKSDSVTRSGRKRDDDAATPTPAILESLPETPMESAEATATEESTPRTPWPFPESQAQLTETIRHQQKPQPQLPAMEELSSSRPGDEGAAIRLPSVQQRSGTTTPEGLSMAERWIQLQQQNLFGRHQHQQQQSSQQTVEEAARRLLQQQQQHHQQQTHHQQILSNLMPWVSGTGGSGGGGSGSGARLHHDWTEASTAQQQLQALLQLRQRHEQQQQQLAQQQLQQQQQQHHHHHHHSNPFSSLGAAAQLRARGWEALAGGGNGSGGVNAAALEMALAHQLQQQQQSHPSAASGAMAGPSTSGPGSRGHSRGASSTDLLPQQQQQQLALAQQLLALHDPSSASSAAADAALALLQRAMGGGSHHPDGPGGGGPYGGSG